MAFAIAQLPDPPDLAVPVLVGGFVFAADLLRALDQNDLSLPVEFLRLRSYGNNRTRAGEMAVLMVPESTAGRHVLLIDGVLDHGRTLKRAREIMLGNGARTATTTVVIDKLRDDALLKADFAAFSNVRQFVVGYGMDDAGRLRSLPYIAPAQ
jgi:hypoxanthine phosphoribosyltransferase